MSGNSIFDLLEIVAAQVGNDPSPARQFLLQALRVFAV
jgi:hypothetical protein